MTDNQLMDSKRLAWACRRGMLELDLIFTDFLKTVYTTLSPFDQLCFQKLLEAPDPELLQWVMGYTEPGDSMLKHVILLIRANMQRHAV